MSLPFIVALTGRSGSGKSYVATLFREAGFPVLDSDVVAREVVDIPACREALKKAFGEDIYQEDVLNRKLLASRAFSSKENTAKLVATTHPFIVESLLAQAQKACIQGQSVVMVDGSTIIDGPFGAYCDKIIVVESDEHIRVQRLLHRDGITEDEIKKRLAAQPSDETYRTHADFTIYNNGTEDLPLQVREAINKMKDWLHEKHNNAKTES